MLWNKYPKSREYLQVEYGHVDVLLGCLKKIDEGEFGMCESCEEPISPKRLEARPETTLCIRCKEEQERDERSFA